MTFLIRFFAIALLLAGSSSFAVANEYYSCLFNGKEASYHQDEVPRMKSLGADCVPLSAATSAICAVGSVSTIFSLSEALTVLQTSNRVSCTIGGLLVINQSSTSTIRPTVLSGSAATTTTGNATATMATTGSATVTTTTTGNAAATTATTGRATITTTTTGGRTTIATITTGRATFELQKTAIVYFKLGSSRLSASEAAKIAEFARYYGSGYQITITGYTDSTGSNATNQLLSLKRAGEARDALIANNVNVSNIYSVSALGEESLRIQTKDSKALGANRAVEIKAYR